MQNLIGVCMLFALMAAGLSGADGRKCYMGINKYAHLVECKGSCYISKPFHSRINVGCLAEFRPDKTCIRMKRGFLCYCNEDYCNQLFYHS